MAAVLSPSQQVFSFNSKAVAGRCPMSPISQKYLTAAPTENNEGTETAARCPMSPLSQKYSAKSPTKASETTVTKSEDTNAFLPSAYEPVSKDGANGSTAANDDEPTLYLSAHHSKFDEPTIAIHAAFANFAAVSPRFALLPIAEAFNWSSLKLPIHLQRTWYGVAFRSLRNPNSARLSPALYQADALAHQEAKESGGLVVYWYGSPDPVTGENLATCVWCSRAEARKANSGPRHLEAVKYAVDAYEHYDLERYVVRKVAGEEFVRVEEYTGGEVGL